MTVLRVFSARSGPRRDAGPSRVARDDGRKACKAARRVAFRGLRRASAALADVPHRHRATSYPEGAKRRSYVLSSCDGGH